MRARDDGRKARNPGGAAVSRRGRRPRTRDPQAACEDRRIQEALAVAGFEYARRYDSAAIVVVLVDRSGVRTAIAATDRVEVFGTEVVDDVASLTQELLEQPARTVPGRAATLRLEPGEPGL